MSSSRSAFAILLVFVSQFAFAQQTVPPSLASPVQRDTQALAILMQALSASGGMSALGGIEDFNATGNITFYWDQSVQGTVTLRGRGLHEFRLDASLSDGVHSSVINSTASFQKNPDGSIAPLPSQNTGKPAISTFPLLQLLAAVQDTSVSVVYGGEVLHDGQQLYDIIVQKTFPANADPGNALSSISRAHFFIDPSALTVESIVDKAYRRDGGADDYPHEMQFSSYQTASGVLVPFSVTESIAGQQTMLIQLNQITFNTGLTDSTFE